MPGELIPVRLSHVLGHHGVGSIVRGPEGLVVVKDTRHWAKHEGGLAGELIPYVERVRSALGIAQQLREPPVARQLRTGQVDGTCVPGMRFPTWLRCPACGTMARRSRGSTQTDQPPRCQQQDCKQKPKLEQVPWVVVHPRGYLADVPWHFLAHKDARAPAQSQCQVKDQLQLIERGYEQRLLRCRACSAETRFRGEERVGLSKVPMQPWTREDLVSPDGDEAESNGSPAQVLGINDTRVYAPLTETVLVIPPESRVRKGTVVDRLYRSSVDRRSIDRARTPLARKSAIRTLAASYRCTTEDLEAALGDIDSGYPLYGENLTPGHLRENEYQAFLEVLPDQREDEDLVTRHQSDEWHALATTTDLNEEERNIVQCVRHLVRVDHLKAVKVFKGFTRLGGSDIVPPDILGKSAWLPAIELHGEGIFLVLDEDRLRIWEQEPGVIARLDLLRPRFVQSGCNTPNPLTTRFMLLHTLSHLLIRQIETEGGYPAAAMMERIYCARAPEAMAGILIHVAVPDLAGSLGGLAELSEPRRFLGILIRALERSRWCSLDPVCSEHEGQGPALLNRAACHGCALLPEPTCEYGNTLLDRGFVKPDPANGLPSFFGIS